mmetsp:Transcript_44159/g.73630  ORF Transcript_44159/g.73630 Transcript_44159/m.73630 type:complete len:218 (+) Transcript_44159:231-884(+)
MSPVIMRPDSMKFIAVTLITGSTQNSLGTSLAIQNAASSASDALIKRMRVADSARAEEPVARDHLSATSSTFSPLSKKATKVVVLRRENTSGATFEREVNIPNHETALEALSDATTLSSSAYTRKVRSGTYGPNATPSSRFVASVGMTRNCTKRVAGRDSREIVAEVSAGRNGELLSEDESPVSSERNRMGKVDDDDNARTVSRAKKTNDNANPEKD